MKIKKYQLKKTKNNLNQFGLIYQNSWSGSWDQDNPIKTIIKIININPQ